MTLSFFTVRRSGPLRKGPFVGIGAPPPRVWTPWRGGESLLSGGGDKLRSHLKETITPLQYTYFFGGFGFTRHGVSYAVLNLDFKEDREILVKQWRGHAAPPPRSYAHDP